MGKLIIVRHGQSLWNLENRFTGWVDVPLTKKGEEEAHAAGQYLQNEDIDIAYTSMLSRAQRTLDIILSYKDAPIPVIKDSALNERHYGDLQGLNKSSAAEAFGKEQVHIWRRSYDTPPPQGESLEMTAERTLPFFRRSILGDISQGKNVLIVAHGNSNRSIIMDLKGLNRSEVMELELDTGKPYIFQVDEKGKLIP